MLPTSRPSLVYVTLGSGAGRHNQLGAGVAWATVLVVTLGANQDPA